MLKYVDFIAFLQKIILKEHVVVIMEFPDWVQVKKNILYLSSASIYEFSNMRFIDLLLFSRLRKYSVNFSPSSFQSVRLLRIIPSVT